MCFSVYILLKVKTFDNSFMTIVRSYYAFDIHLRFKYLHFKKLYALFCICLNCGHE